MAGGTMNGGQICPVAGEAPVSTRTQCAVLAAEMRPFANPMACVRSTTERGVASRKAVIRWLLDADSSIRWQVMQDLTDEPEEAVAAEWSRVTVGTVLGHIIAVARVRA